MSLLLALVPAVALSVAPVLTLEEALRQASERNLDLVAAGARLDQARQASAKAWSGYLPHLTVGGSYTRNSVEASVALPSGYYIRDVFQPQGPPFDPAQEPSPENPPGAPTSLILFPSGFDELTLQRLHQLGAQAELRQAVIAPPLWAAIRAASLGERVAELQADAVRREILFATAQLYFAAAGLKETVLVQERLLELVKRQVADAKVKYEAGGAPRLDFTRAQLDLARAEQDLLRTRNAHAAALGSLATLLDREPDFEVTRPALSPAAMPPIERPELLKAEALEARPDLAAARGAVELAQAQRRGALYAYLPVLGLTAQYRVANVSGFAGRADTWALIAGLSWTLWDGGLREAQLREAAARVREADAQLRSAENKARDEVRRALLDLATARGNRERSEQEVKLATETLGLVQQAYDAGGATSLDVSVATGALLGAELSRLREELNAQLASLSLLKSIGAFDHPLRTLSETKP